MLVRDFGKNGDALVQGVMSSGHSRILIGSNTGDNDINYISIRLVY